MMSVWGLLAFIKASDERTYAVSEEKQMKTTGWRSLILYHHRRRFLVGLIFFICSYFIQGGSWAIRPPMRILPTTVN